MAQTLTTKWRSGTEPQSVTTTRMTNESDQDFVNRHLFAVATELTAHPKDAAATGCLATDTQSARIASTWADVAEDYGCLNELDTGINSGESQMAFQARHAATLAVALDEDALPNGC